MPSMFARYREARRTRRWIRWVEDGLIFALVLGAVLAWQTRNLVPSGEMAPAFQLTDLQGRTWSSSELKGKKVVLHFWAPWCSVCKAESGTISRLAKSADEDEVVLSVALAYEDVKDVETFARAQDVAYPVLLGDDALMRAYRIEAFPTTYIVSEEGRIRRASVGFTTGLGLRLRLWL